MKNNFKKGFIVSVILGIISLLLIGGGVYLYKNKKAVAPTVETEQSNQNQLIRNHNRSLMRLFSLLHLR